jgi:hypothetical protein
VRARKLLAGLLALVAVVAVLAAGPPSVAGKGRPHHPGPPPERTYLYDVTFTVTVHHAYRLFSGPGSSTDVAADAEIEGTIPGVYVTRRSAWSANPLQAGLTRATGGVGLSKLDEAGITSCTGETVPYDRYQVPGLSLGRERRGKPTTHLYPFQALRLPMTCTGPGGVTAGEHVLPGFGLPPVGAGFRAGRKVFHKRFELDLEYTADPSDRPCPEERPGYTDYCSYTLDARATFRLVKAPR